MPRVSIVIPALNEEQFLPTLLDCIARQTYKDFEIIVADAGSKDRTAEIAWQRGARVVPGGSPARGRNRGASTASGEFLAFLDADVRLADDFLELAVEELDERFVDLATCEFVPDSSLRFDQLLFRFANLAIKLNRSLNPRAPGFCIFITSRLFRRVGGFDEQLKLAEDHDLVQRASRFRPLRVLNNSNVVVSTRRLEKEGRLTLIAKYARVEMHLLLKGKVTEDVIEYEFANFEKKSDRNKNLLDQLESRIIEAEHRYDELQQSYQQYRDKFVADAENAASSAYKTVETWVRNLFDN